MILKYVARLIGNKLTLLWGWGGEGEDKYRLLTVNCFEAWFRTVAAMDSFLKALSTFFH